MKNKIITLTGNFRKEKFFDIINQIFEYFSNVKGYELLMTDEFLKDHSSKVLNNNINVNSFDICINKSDYIFSIGGDGTILSTIRKLSSRSVPVLGIHIGNLGFLAMSTEESLNKALDHIVANEYVIKDKVLLKTFKQSNPKEIYYSFNDVVIDHGNSGRVLKTIVSNHDEHINDYEGDGIIICTPTGSTAYSLSSGGPIVHSDLDVLTITPISSHSLSARPIVLSSDSNIKIKFSNSFIDASLTIDGQIRLNLNKDDTIIVSKAKFYAKIIFMPYYSYIQTLKEKLHWSGNSR
tara:strand:+ start:3719 stop:4600 length:882 start_codon:yes stop_codon:yes gene_type:complete